MNRVLPMLSLALLLLFLAAPAHAERKVALVIGNGAYKHAPPLANPVNDARLMAESLKAIGFELVNGRALTDIAGKTEMEQAVRRFGELIRGGGVGLFYYAGHGVQVDGKNYLIPVGADVAAKTHIKYELVDADYILDEMASSNTSVNVIILDACRNNPFAGRGLRAVTPGLASVMAPKGTLVAYSTAPGKTAADGKGRNSPFTSALAKAIRAPGLRIEDVFMQVGAEVEQATAGEQSPWKSDNLRGVFCLSGDCAATSPARFPANAAVTAGTPAPHGAGKAAELAFWDAVKSSSDPADVEAFLAQYPASELAPVARIRLRDIRNAAQGKAPSPLPLDRSGPCPQGFAGKWSSSYGTLLIRLEGNKVIGTYDYGELRGTLSGSVITGEWFDSRTIGGVFNGNGPLRFELSEDGRTFSGNWTRVSGFGKSGGTWTGTCQP